MSTFLVSYERVEMWMKKAGRLQVKRLLLLFVTVLLAVMVFTPVDAYAESGYCTVNLEVEKQLQGNSSSDSEEYVFVLEGKEGAPLPNENIVKIVGDGKASFPDITFTEPETYHYTIREVPGDSEECIYDSSIYDVMVQVTTNDEGYLSATVWAMKQGETSKTEKILFINSYDTVDEEEPSDKENDFFELLPKTGDLGLFVILPLFVIGIAVVSLCIVFAICRRRI